RPVQHAMAALQRAQPSVEPTGWYVSSVTSTDPWLVSPDFVRVVQTVFGSFTKVSHESIQHRGTPGLCGQRAQMLCPARRGEHAQTSAGCARGRRVVGKVDGSVCAPHCARQRCISPKGTRILNDAFDDGSHCHMLEQ